MVEVAVSLKNRFNMKNDVYESLTDMLDQLQQALQGLNEWSDKTPSPEALSSVQPFCYDTLRFPEWLQFVFIVRMRQIIAGRQSLPGACGIAPMVEEHFKSSRKDISELLRILETIDQILSD
jgi:uncharacterized protein YqcC (DUF446 family)